jgi:hypothetical protein
MVLALKHPDWKALQLAEVIGHSERWTRKWTNRFEMIGEPHFSMYLSQLRAPKTRPRQTPKEVKDVVCELRETLSEQYHRPAGATLIRHFLLQDKNLKDTDFFIPTSSRTITQILRERGYIQIPKKHERIPLALCSPMAEWEMDFCEIRLQDGWFEFFLVVDRGTSRVVYLEGCEGYRADTALLAMARLFLLNGLPQRLRFDRDPRFVWSWSADSFPAPSFAYYMFWELSQSFVHRVARIRSPMSNVVSGLSSTNGWIAFRSTRWRIVMKHWQPFRITTTANVFTWGGHVRDVHRMKPFPICPFCQNYHRSYPPIAGLILNTDGSFGGGFERTAQFKSINTPIMLTKS